MSPSNTTMATPLELDDAAAWSAYRRTHAVDFSEMITLRDGADVRMRAIQPDDVDRLQQFHSRLSLDSIVMRFFRVVPVLRGSEAWRLTHLDYDNRMALVATNGTGDDERIIGVVRYERVTATEGELAFVIDDQWQGRGISTQLLARLLSYARERGFERMTAITMATNMRMRAVLAHTAFSHTAQYADGCLNFTIDLTATTVARN